MRLRSLHRAYPSFHPSGVVLWVPRQLNIKAVTGACKLNDGCSLALCSAQFQWYQLAYETEMKSIQLNDFIVGLSQKIVSLTFTSSIYDHQSSCRDHYLVVVVIIICNQSSSRPDYFRHCSLVCRGYHYHLRRRCHSYAD